MTAPGWIRLHRKSLGSQVFSNPSLWRFWCWLLFKANWKPSFFAGRQIEAGQVAFSQESASDQFGVDRKTIYRWMTELEKLGQIERCRAQQITLITICNWEVYQSDRSDYAPRDVPSDAPRDAPSDVPHPKKLKNPQELKEDLALPRVLDCDAFRSAWRDWTKHRIEIRKELTPSAIQRQLSKLEAMGVQRAIATIQNSIEQGYVGLFEPGTRGGTPAQQDRHSGIKQALERRNARE